MSKVRVFVSSAQEELENERVAIAELINSDAFLAKHCEAVLFEQQPASTLPAERAYLAALDECDVYVGLLGFEYRSSRKDGLSAVHREYLRAKKRGMSVFIFVKGHSGRDKDRDKKMQDFLALIRDAQKGHTYRRFSHYQDLKERVRESLLEVLEERGVSPTSSEQIQFEQTLAAASDFDSQLLEHVDSDDLDAALTATYAGALLAKPASSISQTNVQKELLNRGMLWRDTQSEILRPTAAGLLLFGNAPDGVFPQCRITANAYGGIERGEPIDRRDIRLPLPKSIQEAFDFLVRNMRHTNTVVGFSRVEIDEYPYEALREALINAVAHRDYELTGSSIRVEKYADRIVILSPGLPPPPITIEKIRTLRYQPCSRNPNIARGLSYFERIEEQGDGIRRIVTVTTDMGLPAPQFQQIDGHFAVIFKGPGKSLLKLKPQKPRPLFEVQPSKIETLTPNQKAIIRELLGKKQVEVPNLAAVLKVTEQSIRKDLRKLQKLKLAEKRGAARATYYVLKEQQTSA
jgi:predicted HTH transcriptional regulator